MNKCARKVENAGKTGFRSTKIMIPLLVSEVNPFPLWLLKWRCWRKIDDFTPAILAAALTLGQDAAVTLRVGSRLARS
jgi:hypothetical protein